jgi:hypothetical protein
MAVKTLYFHGAGQIREALLQKVEPLSVTCEGRGLGLFAIAQRPGQSDAYFFFVSQDGEGALLERPQFCSCLPPMAVPCVVVKRVGDFTMGVTLSEWRQLFRVCADRSRVGTNEGTDVAREPKEEELAAPESGESYDSETPDEDSPRSSTGDEALSDVDPEQGPALCD